jgi:pimeloyl-ACP methyl ester carboxylesterase
MRFAEWGDARNPRVLVCVHGLTRNGRDFDYLAQGLADAFRVVCPDVVGRGRSDWLRDPLDYTYPTYNNDMAALIASLHVETVDWLGTSMGGIIGMILASLPGSPVRRLVMNDVGLMVPKAALDRIGLYVGTEPSFSTLEGLEVAMRGASPFGELTPEQWRHLAIHSSRQEASGRWRFRYDPGIGLNFRRVAAADIDLRAYWNAVHGPVMVIRGEDSDLLLPATLEEMCARPHTSKLLVPRTGHAPMLMDDYQVGAVRHFLLS